MHCITYLYQNKSISPPPHFWGNWQMDPIPKRVINALKEPQPRLHCPSFKCFITQGAGDIFFKIKVPVVFHGRFSFKKLQPAAASFPAIKLKPQHSFHRTNNESLMCTSKFLSSKNHVCFCYIIYSKPQYSTGHPSRSCLRHTAQGAFTASRCK